MLKVKAKQIDFPKLFNDFMEKTLTQTYSFYDYPDNDTIWGDDEDYAAWWAEYLDYKEGKSKEKKKSSVTEITDDEYDSDEKYIYYYEDLTNKTLRNEYNSLFEFDEFISEEDIDITESEILYLMNNKVIHCTSIVGANGKKYLIASNSWSTLCFKCENVSNIK